MLYIFKNTKKITVIIKEGLEKKYPTC